MTNTLSMMTDMKITKPCRRRVIRSDGRMLCKPPLKCPGMSDKDYIEVHRKNRPHQITPEDCDRCQNAELPKSRPQTTSKPIGADDPCSSDKELPATLLEMPEMPEMPKVSHTESLEKPQEPHTATLEITPLGTLIYPRTAWEPPPCPPGYHRADTEDTWVLELDIPICKHLELGSGAVGSCGYSRVTRRCLSIDSFVGPRTCESCQSREEPDAG